MRATLPLLASARAALANNCQRLQGQAALVTGAAHGIGKSIVMRLAAEGASIVATDIEEEAGRACVADVREKTGAEIEFVKADISQEGEVIQLLAKSRELFGPLNVLVNNAARFHFGPLEKATREDWLRLFDTNVIGYANTIREALPHFREHGAGSVVNLASVSSFIAQPEMFIYNSSKGAVAQLTRCLALDFALENIRVNAVCPGTIRTPAVDRHIAAINLPLEDGLTLFAKDSPMDRLGDPSEVASAVAFLASSDASYVTGSMLIVDGGRMLP